MLESLLAFLLLAVDNLRDSLTQAEVLAKRIPGSEHKILKGQSHGFFWQVPEDTNSWIIAWVLSHASETA